MSVASISGYLDQMAADIAALQALVSPVTLTTYQIQGSTNHVDNTLVTLIPTTGTITPARGTYVLSGVVKFQTSDNTTILVSSQVSVNRAGTTIETVSEQAGTTPRESIVFSIDVTFDGTQTLQVIGTADTQGVGVATYDIIGAGGPSGNNYSSYVQLLKISSNYQPAQP